VGWTHMASVEREPIWRLGAEPPARSIQGQRVRSQGRSPPEAENHYYSKKCTKLQFILTLMANYNDISANYLLQVNEVNGGDNAFVCVCLSVCVCVCARSGRSWELNANSVPRDCPDMTPKIFPKGQGHVTP